MAVPRQEPPPPTAGRVRMVLDTDTYNEIDDQFALVHALLSPEVMDVQGIYAAPFLNRRSRSPADGMEKSHAEILRICERLDMGTEGLVYRGARHFMDGEDGAVSSPAMEHLLHLIHAEEQPLYVVAIGAPTNIASVLVHARQQGLDLAGRLRVVWLGGQPFHSPSAREFNLQQDPVASRILLAYSPSLTLIPCQGVASHLLTTMAELERHLAHLGPIGPYLISIFRAYTEDHFGWAKEIWDLAATAYLVNPDWVPTRVMDTMDLDPETLAWRPPVQPQPVRVATMVHRNPVFRDLFTRIAAHVTH